MLRVFASRLDEDGVELSDEEWHHLLRVRRARDGEEVEVLDGAGTALLCTLVTASTPPSLQPIERVVEAPPAWSLAIALVRRERFEWALQKAVELGAAALVPLQTERTQPRALGRRPERLAVRWRSLMIEALKQSGNRHLPRLAPVTRLADWLDDGRRTSAFGYLDPEGQPPGPALKALTDAREATLLVGPEGGWTETERRMMDAAGGLGLSLGPRILRTETAAVVALALLQYESAAALTGPRADRTLPAQ